jgi:hypothetical protein
MNLPYQLVELANGAVSVRSVAHQETFHPVVGPAAEAESLYLQPFKRITARLHGRVAVIWDVGLGAAGNALSVLRANPPLPLALVSFDSTSEPLQFALDHAERLPYLFPFQSFLRELLVTGQVRIQDGLRQVDWRFHQGDFPSLLDAVLSGQAPPLPPPNLILFDPFSPAKNPAMWTLPLFQRLFRCLDCSQPCLLSTYSRSTALRVTLLRAGFFVGRGGATGEKEETTLAANELGLLDRALDGSWLKRARVSTSAEPMIEPQYQQLPISESTWAQLQNHPQFKGAPSDGVFDLSATT